MHTGSKFSSNPGWCALRYWLFVVTLWGCGRAVVAWDAGGGDSRRNDADAWTAPDGGNWVDATVLPVDEASRQQEPWNFVEISEQWLPYEVPFWGGPRGHQIFARFSDSRLWGEGFRFEVHYEGGCRVARMGGEESANPFVSAGTLTVTTNGGAPIEVVPHGMYLAYSYSRSQPLWRPGDRIGVFASGDQVPAFFVELTMPPPVQVTGLGRVGESLRLRARDGLTIEWEETSAPYVWVRFGASFPDGAAWEGAVVNCHFPGRLGRGVIAPSVLERLMGGIGTAGVHTADVRLLRVGRYLVHVVAAHLVHGTGQITVE